MAVISGDAINAALEKAQKKILEEKEKRKAQMNQQQTTQQTTTDTEVQSRGFQTQGEKDLNTIKSTGKTAISGDKVNEILESKFGSKSSTGVTQNKSKASAAELKKAIDDKPRQTGWEKFQQSFKDLGSAVKQIGQGLISEYITNQDKSKGILDYDKYQQYQDMMASDNTTQEQRTQLMNKMINEGIVDPVKYNSWIKDVTIEQQTHIDREINAVKDKQNEEFRDQIKKVFEPYVSNVSNHYQMDAYTKATDRLMKQYQMTFDNVVETYDDTRNEAIIDAWASVGENFRKNILEFADEWGRHISEGMTDTEAYKATIKNKKNIADKIVDTENYLTSLQYRVTMKNNFSKEGNISGTILTQVTNAILGVTNFISYAFSEGISQPIEELKQKTNYYDIVEELANLNIQDEADGWMKRGYKTVASRIRSIYDAAPTVIPSVISMFLAGKISKSAEAAEKVKTAEIGIKKMPGYVKQGLSYSKLLSIEMAEDIFMLDTTFQLATGRPMTREDAVWNMIPNVIIDSFSARAMSRPAREYLSNMPRGALLGDIFKKEMVDQVAKMSDIGEIADYIYHYMSIDIANGTEKVGKTVDLTELIKVDPNTATKVSVGGRIAAEMEEKVLSGKMTVKDLAGLVLDNMQKEFIEARNAAKSATNSAVNNLGSKIGYDNAGKLLDNTASGVSKSSAKAPATDVNKIAMNLTDDSRFIANLFKQDTKNEMKAIQVTVKGMVASGLIDENSVLSMIRTASKGNDGVFNYIAGLMVSAPKAGQYLEAGIKYFDQLQKELGNSKLAVASLLGDAYDDLFKQVLLKYNNAIQNGQQIGMYMKSGASEYTNIMTGEIKKLEDIIKEYGGSGLDRMGNRTISNLTEQASDIKKSAQFASDYVDDLGYVKDNVKGYEKKVKKVRHDEGGVIWEENFYHNGKEQGGTKSMLMNKYFTKKNGTDADGKAIETLGGFTGKQLRSNPGLYTKLQKMFDDVGFDFVVGRDDDMIYIWSRNLDNADKFADALGGLSTKTSVLSMTNFELSTFKVAHIDEYIDQMKAYAKANGIGEYGDWGGYANNFKTWFERLYKNKGSKSVIDKYGTAQQINRLSKSVSENVNLEIVEAEAAENAISSNVSYINDLWNLGQGKKTSIQPGKSNTKDLQFTKYRDDGKGKAVVLGKKIADDATRRDTIKSILRQTFSDHYNKPEMYEKILNRLTDFIIEFHKTETGITQEIVEGLGNLYSTIITSPESLMFINKVDTPKNKFFDILTAKLINAGADASARDFNQGFANYVSAISDNIYNRIGKRYSSLDKYIEDNIDDKVLTKGMRDLLYSVNAKMSDASWKKSSTKEGIYKMIDSNEIKQMVDKMGIINKEGRERFFREGLSDRARNRIRQINSKYPGTKNIKIMSADEVTDYVDYIIYKHLEKAGLYDYNLLTSMREGVADRIIKAANNDKNMQIVLDVDGIFASTPYLSTKGEGKNVLRLGNINITRLWMRGSYATEIFKEAVTHELNHIDDFIAYAKGLDEYIKGLRKKIAGLNVTDRKDLLDNLSYLLTGYDDIDEVIRKMQGTSQFSTIDSIATYIWNKCGQNADKLSTISRFEISKDIFNELVRPLEEVLTEAYTLNAVFGRTYSLPTNFESALKGIEERYKLINDALNTLGSSSFKDFNEFKKTLYTNAIKPDTKWVIEGVSGGEVKAGEEAIDDLGFVAEYDINGKKFIKEIDINGNDILDAQIKKEQNTNFYKHLYNKMAEKIAKQSNGRVDQSIINFIKKTELDEDAFFMKYLNGVKEGMSDYDWLKEVTESMGGSEVTEDVIRARTRTITPKDIFLFSTIGQKTSNNFEGGSFLDQINKAFIGKINYGDKWQEDWVMRETNNLFGLIDKERQKKGLTKSNDVRLGGWTNNQTLPLIDDKIGQKLATKLDEIIRKTSGSEKIRLDVNKLLIGEDLINSYYEYLSMGLANKNLSSMMSGVEIDGKYYTSFDNFIKDKYGIDLSNNKEWKQELEKMNYEILNGTDYGIEGDVEFLGVVSDDVYHRIMPSYEGWKAINEWNDAVISKFTNDSLRQVVGEQELMSLETYVMSRHAISILSALGQYTGEGDEVIKGINEELKNTILDKLFSELARENNINPMKFILSELTKVENMPEEDAEMLIKLYTNNFSEYDKMNMLRSLKGYNIGEMDKAQIDKAFEILLEELGIGAGDLTQINQSIGNYLKTLLGGQGQESIDDALGKTAGRIYEKFVNTEASMKYMKDHGGRLPDSKKKLYDENSADYASIIDSIKTIVQDYQEAYVAKNSIHDMPEMIYFEETKPYNLTSNNGIRAGQYIRVGHVTADSSELRNVVKEINFDGGSKYYAKNNISQTINGVPVSSQMSYLQANGLAKAKREGKVGNVWIELDSLLKTEDNFYGRYLTEEGDTVVKFNDKPRKYNLSTDRVIGEDGSTVRDFTSLDLLRQLLITYDNKRTIGVIVESPKGAFQKTKAGTKGNINIKEIDRKGEPTYQINGLMLSYNNIFSSFVGRDLCRRLGIETEFLNSNQSNIGVLSLIQKRINDMYNKEMLMGKPRDENEYLQSLSSLVVKMDRILGEAGDEGFSFIDSLRSKQLIDNEGETLGLQIVAYNPTFSVGKLLSEEDSELAEGFLKGEMVNDINEGAEATNFEIKSANRWISSQIEYDNAYDDFLQSYMGESVTITPVTSGPIIVKCKSKAWGFEEYGIVQKDYITGEYVFTRYSDMDNYYQMFKDGDITEAEYEALILLGDSLSKINDNEGLKTVIRATTVNGVDYTNKIEAISKMNKSLEKLQSLEQKLMKLKDELEKGYTIEGDEVSRRSIEKLQKEIEETEEELNKVSDIYLKDRMDALKEYEDIKVKELQKDKKNTDDLGFTKDDRLDIVPTKAIDIKARAKGSISNKFIGYADGLEGSSTAEYAKQAGDKANVGKYEKGDVVFVSVPGKRGDYKIRHEQQNKTILEAAKALDEGATIITDSKAYLRKSDYNEGEKRLMDYFYKKGYVYKNVDINGTTVGSWTKPEGKITPYKVKKNDFNAKKIWSEGNIPAIRRTIEGEYSGPHSFGNPFDGRTRGEYGVKEATNRFYHWIKGDAYQDVNPEQREWIVNQIKNGSLKGKTVVYYTDAIPSKENDYGVKEYDALHPNHAMVLQRFINGEYKIGDVEDFGFAKEDNIKRIMGINDNSVLERDEIFDDVLDEMDEGVEGEAMPREYVFNKWLKGEMGSEGLIFYEGTEAAEKDLGEQIKEINKYNSIKGVISNDGTRYLPGTAEANKALENGGTDMRTLQDMIMLSDYVTKSQMRKISTNLFSFGNYDIIESNDVLNEIAGHRSRFMDNNGIELKQAIDEFNTLISDYTQEEKEEIYNQIIEKARRTLNSAVAETKSHPFEFSEKACDIDIKGNESVTAAIRKIGDIFVHRDTATPLNPSWSWILQFATLNSKGGFDDLRMRLSSNEFSSTADYLLKKEAGAIYNGKDLRDYVRGLAKTTGASDSKVERFVHDRFGDSLGTSSLYKIDANLKSIYRITKYSPLSPISGTLMLAQSVGLGTAMYLAKRRGLGFIMNMPEFELLTLAKGEKKVINGVEYEGLGWLNSLTRQGDINLNSNTDLGRTFIDRSLDRLLGIIPMPKKMRESVQSVMKGGLQSIYDIFAQDSIKQMSLAQALASNGITSEFKFRQLLKRAEDGTVDQALISRILGNAEINYSRFFSNSATTVMSRNRFSRRWLFNCMNNYTILRSDEVIQGVTKFWRDWKSGLINDMAFGDYLLQYNPELKGLMNNVLMGIKIGYYLNNYANGETDSRENLEKYIVDSSDYLSSIPATFFYNILSAPFKGVGEYIDYTNAVGESETFGGAAQAATLKTLSSTMTQFFREGKVLNVMRDWLISYAKTGDLDFASTVAGVDLEKIANGLGRFMLVEGTETYGSASLPEIGDPIGQILFNNFETNQYGKAKTKLNNIVTAEEYVNGNIQDSIINILAYMPVVGEFIKNSVTGQGFSFTQAKYEELMKMVDTDPVIQDMYKGIIDTSYFTDDSISRLYSDLIKFDYTANRTLGQNGEYKLGSYDKKTGKDITLNDMKEAVFTKNMLDKLGMTREEFVAKLNKADQDGDKKALIKILAIAQAAEPGSSRVCLSYLANNYHYELMKEYSGKDYPSGNDVTEDQANEINRRVVERYYPDMFVVDKTSWYKAVREYISIANPTIFDTLYKDDDLSGYVNSLGYLDMLMFQFAHEGDVDARYIKNAFSLIGKYVQDTDARVSIMNHTMQTIADLDTYDSLKTMMKMGVIAGNTDIYDKVKKDEVMQIMNKDLLKRYENFVWGVDQEINQKGTDLANKELSEKEKKQYKGLYGKKYKYSNYANGNSGVKDDVEKFAAKVFPIADTPIPTLTTIPYTPTTFTPSKHSPLYFYIRIYEDTIKETSDKLVTTTGKKYPAQTIEGMTYHGKESNKGRISAKKLEFPTKRRRATSYSTDRRAGYPGG